MALKRLEEGLAEYYGWATTPASRATLTDAIAGKAERLQIGSDEYCEIAASSQSEMLALVEEAAVGETFFFRESQQFDSLRERILPTLLAAIPATGMLRIWSTACSTGEEAYSLAIVCDQVLGSTRSRESEVFATDVRNRALLVASQARYSTLALDNIEQTLRERYFIECNEKNDPLSRSMVSVVPEVRRMVTLRRVNLLEQIFWKAMAGRFDLIVCANLLLYLHGVAIRQMVGRLAHSLRPDGFLMVASTESHFVDHPKLSPVVNAPTMFSRIG